MLDCTIRGCHVSSGWFSPFEPPRTTVWLNEPSLQDSFTWVRGGSRPTSSPRAKDSSSLLFLSHKGNSTKKKQIAAAVLSHINYSKITAKLCLMKKQSLQLCALIEHDTLRKWIVLIVFVHRTHTYTHTHLHTHTEPTQNTHTHTHTQNPHRTHTHTHTHTHTEHTHRKHTQNTHTEHTHTHTHTQNTRRTHTHTHTNTHTHTHTHTHDIAQYSTTRLVWRTSSSFAMSAVSSPCGGRWSWLDSLQNNSTHKHQQFLVQQILISIQ